MPRSYAIFLLNLKSFDILMEKGMYSAPFLMPGWQGLMLAHFSAQPEPCC